MLMPAIDGKHVFRVLAASVLAGALVWVSEQFQANRAGLEAPAAQTPQAPTGPAEQVPKPIDTAHWVIGLSGLGPITVEKQVEHLAAELPWPLDPVAAAAAGRDVLQPRNGPPGLQIVVRDGRVAAVRTSDAWRTRSGVGVGDSVERLRATYPSHVRPFGGSTTDTQFYEFVPRDSQQQQMRVVFRTERGAVTAICAGRLPEVAAACGAPEGTDVQTSTRTEDARADPLTLGFPPAVAAWLNAARPGWTLAAVSQRDIDDCGSSLTTPAGTAAGDFDNDGTVDRVAWIDTSGKVELVMFITGSSPQVLESGREATGTLLVTIPRGQSIMGIGGKSIVLRQDAVSVLHCGQSQYVYVRASGHWNQYWISD